MIEKDKIFELNVTGLGSSGEGVGSINGLKVFVEGGLPGEKILVRILKRKSSYAIGQMIKILEQSFKRTEPPCNYFTRCGGCQIMHLDYSGQLEVKTKRVKETLKRLGGIESIEVFPCIASPQELGYRNKIQLPIACDGNGILLGLYAKGTHQIIAVQRCLIHCEIGEKVFRSVQNLIRNSGLEAYNEAANTGTLRHLLIKTAVHAEKALVVLITTGKNARQVKLLADEILNSDPSIAGVIENINDKKGNAILGGCYKTLAGQPFLLESLCGSTFKVSPASFFQVNTPQAEILYKTAIQLADLRKDDRLFDLYCGVGTLALIASAYVKDVIGIEIIPQAIEDAQDNAKRNNITNTRFLCGKAEVLIGAIGKADAVFLNPPRGGCDPLLLDILGNFSPKKIIYISCDPATLARDLAIIIKKGYSLDCVQPIDMFPQTMHVETVVRLSKIANG